MNVKIFIYLTTICQCFVCVLNAQTGIVGHEKYNSYEQHIYVDNLVQILISEIFVSTYYSELKKSDFKTSQVIDTICQKREINIHTKKVKDGYLFVNKSIMDKIKNIECDLDRLKISYVYNNKLVTTKKGVMEILRLREKRIRISEIIYDKQLEMITVYVLRH
ncbi:MAG: hypothetical protein FWD56_05980 [Bacteroidales bacterium]|nr:hypothetical protein [Bacteroidales bacterium]